jgi:hypothetical protein
LPAACKTKDNTELVVTVWSDLAVPTEMDALRIRVAGKEQTLDHPFQLTSNSEPGKYQIPVQLALVPAGVKDLSITVTAVGSYFGTDMVSQQARLPFIPGQGRELVLYLARSCKNIFCNDHPGYTCENGACGKPVAVDTTQLPPYVSGQVAATPEPGVVSAQPDAGASPDAATLTPDSRVGDSGGDSGTGSPDSASADRPIERSDTAVPVGGLTVNQPALDFGSVDQGDTATKTVTVTNTGLPASVGPQVVGIGYTIQSTSCAGALATNGSCTITIAFSPAVNASGGAAGTLTIGTGIGAIAVSLSATATALGTFSAALSVLPATALVDQAVPFTVTVTPAGPLPDLSCLNSGPDLSPDPVAANTTCAATALAPVVQSCVYAFIFKGTKAGIAMDQITCSSSGNVQTLPVSVTVLSPASLTIAPTPGAFAAVVSATSEPITFRVRNSGTAPSGALSAALGGTGAAQFAMTDNQCSGVLLGGAACTITVVYKPTAAGAVNASLTVTDATVGSTPATATLNGSAVTSPTLAIAGAQDLGTVTVGETGTASIYTVTNTGGSTSGLVTIAATDAQFAIGNNLCGPSLAAAGTCTFTVAFAPGSEGLKTTVITAKSGGIVSAQKQVQGTGKAVKVAALSMSPPTLDFGTIGVGTTAGPHVFTVTNNGGTATGMLNVTNLDSTSSVGGASQFTYVTTCSPALAPGATCFVAVTFAPTIAGSASATITVSDGTVSSPGGTVLGIALDRATVGLDCGSGTSSASTGSSETFADTIVGKSATVACTVSNTQDSPQATGAIQIAVTGDFAVPAATNNCTASLLPGLSCTFALTFTPTATGQRNGTLTVTTDNQGARNQNLGGVGIGAIEIVEIAPCTSPNPALCFPIVSPGAASNLVASEPFDFGQVTQTTTSTTILTLAVYVRAAVNTLSVTKDFGTPESFAFGSVPGGLGVDCSTLPSVTAVQASVTTPVCYKLVQFTPQTRGPTVNGTVTVNGPAGQTDSATMKGMGVGPLTISPSSAIFANVGVGTSSTTISLTVKNSGSIAIDNMTYTLTGTNANQFAVVGDSLTGASIAAGGGTQFLGVRYVPTAAGGATATITVTGNLHNGAGTESQTVNLTGNGATGAVMTVAISNNGVFANTAAGAFSAPLAVTVSNAAGSPPTGNVYFTVSGSDFQVSLTGLPAGTTQGTCQQVGNGTVNGGMPVAGGGSCTYLVWFAPSMANARVARTGTLLVTASPGGSVSLPLSGNALPQLTISPTGIPATPVDLGTAVMNTLPNPSVAFTVTNNAATDIPPNGLSISQVLSPNIPNNQALFYVDTTALNGCNATNSVPKNGGICTFKLSAITIGFDGAPLGVNYSRMLVQVAAHTAQSAQADVKATVVTGPSLMFTPATDVAAGTARDLGTIALGSHSAPAKYTLVNVGGTNAGAITAFISLHAQPGVVQSTPRYSVDASACIGLGEAGLAPGRTCDILVTFTPTATDTNAILTEPDQSVDLVVPPTNGLAVELRRWIRAEVTSSQTGPYLVDSITHLAPSNMTGPVGSNNVYTATLDFHAGTTAITPAAGLATATPDVMTVTAGDVAGCVAGETVPAAAMCTLKLTFTAGATPTPGWHVFTVTTNDASATKLNVFARVPQPAQLVASRSTVAFGGTMIAVQSQTQTVVITNVGEATTAGNVVVTPSGMSLINTSGCSGLPLAYMGTCTLAISVTPTALGSGSGTITATAMASPISVSWTGVTASQLTTTNPETDFGSQAVLSTNPNTHTFTFQNGANALMTGPLTISVLNGTAVDPDFVITGGTCVTANLGLGLDAGQSCTVTVVFTPTALPTPAKSGMLTVSASPGGTATVRLDGKAVPALRVTGPSTVVTATDGSKSLAVGTTAIGGTGISGIVVTFTNEVGSPQTGLLSVALGGTNAADFRVTDDNCTGVQLATTGVYDAWTPGTCTVTLTFAPTSVGVRTATVTVSGSPGDSALLTLTGNGTSP